MENVIVERPTLTAPEVKAGIDLILQVMKSVMKNGVDYGVVPGCGDKPTLLKPGSEKILATFKIGVDPEVEDLSTEDEARFRVKTRLFHEVTGIELGKGVGEASSHEEKYKWRKAVCDEEFAETAEDRKRLAWKPEWKGGSRTGKYIQVKQVRTSKADVSNTVLKMAKKRSQIDGTLTATAASAIFNQDLEDMEEEIRDAVIGDAPPTKEPIKEPEAKPTQQSPVTSQAQSEGLQIKSVRKLKSGTSDKGEWNLWLITDAAGTEYKTFDDSSAALAKTAHEQKKGVKIESAAGPKGNDLKSIVMVGESA